MHGTIHALPVTIILAIFLLINLSSGYVCAKIHRKISCCFLLHSCQTHKKFIPFSEVNTLARIWPMHKHYCIVDIALCLLAITQRNYVVLDNPSKILSSSRTKSVIITSAGVQTWRPYNFLIMHLMVL